MKIETLKVMTLTRLDLIIPTMLKGTKIDIVRFSDDTTEEEFKASGLYTALLPCIHGGPGLIIYNKN